MNLRNLTAANAATLALALSDGTPVDFVKVTSKDNIQVKLPADHPYASGQDNGRIFRRDGSHFKGQTNLTLIATPKSDTAPAATPAVATTPAPVVASNDNVTYVVGDNSFDNFDDAREEAFDIFSDTGENVEIVATTRRVVGTFGFVRAA